METWIDKTYLMPDILKEGITQEDYLTQLEQYLSKHEIQVLFVGIGFELPMFAKTKERILKNTGCTVVVSSEDIISMSRDKYKTYEFLKANGLNYPETWTDDEIELFQEWPNSDRRINTDWNNTYSD